MRIALATLATAVVIGGCGANPFGAQVLPPVGEQTVRIVEGVGGSRQYKESVEVIPGNLVQIRTEIALGETVDIFAPKGPARVIEFVAEGDSSTTSTTIRSADGKTFSVHGASEFFPGGVGIQDLSDEETLHLRVSLPRLPGSEQEHVAFRFTTAIVRGAGDA